MKKAIAIQLLIFIGTYFSMTPDILEDNTHVFGLIGDVEVIKGNTIWVMLGAAVLSAINIWVWWPKPSAHKTVGDNAGTKSAEAKAEEAKAEDVKVDPVVPKMD